MIKVGVEVDVRHVIREVEPRTLGINIDYLVDHDENRPAGARPLEEALREMGVRSLRFPGGDKSDNHLWSLPPCERPRPALACGPRQGREAVLMDEAGEWQVRRMDFDEFMGLCRRLRAEPTVVVCYDALHHPGCQVTRQQLLETAVAWVEYARRQGYGVRYWEIGNEGYIEKTVSAADYAADLVEFAQAMKRADPTILIGANGPDSVGGPGAQAGEGGEPWWKVVFEGAAEHIDFAAVHIYPCWEWGGYEAYRERGPEVARSASAALEAARRWAPAEVAERLRVAITEYNSADWSKGGWPAVNTLGHALVTFDIIGELLQHERVDMAQLWNTRWVSHPPEHASLWDALDERNELQASGRALAIWGQFVGERMVEVRQAERLRASASHSPGDNRVSVFLVSKEETDRQAVIGLEGLSARSAECWRLRGEGPEDERPSWSGPEPAQVRGGRVEVELPGDSLTVVALR